MEHTKKHLREKRSAPYGASVTFGILEDDCAWLDNEASRVGKSRAQLVRDIINAARHAQQQQKRAHKDNKK